MSETTVAAMVFGIIAALMLLRIWLNSRRNKADASKLKGTF